MEVHFLQQKEPQNNFVGVQNLLNWSFIFWGKKKPDFFQKQLQVKGKEKEPFREETFNMITVEENNDNLEWFQPNQGEVQGSPVI